MKLLSPRITKIFADSTRKRNPTFHKSGASLRLVSVSYFALEITKVTVLTWFPFTVTDFSQVFGSLNTGR
jgi:hypothetical protein